jgi:hypothetical protein
MPASNPNERKPPKVINKMMASGEENKILA